MNSIPFTKSLPTSVTESTVVNANTGTSCEIKFAIVEVNVWMANNQASTCMVKELVIHDEALAALSTKIGIDYTYGPVAWAPSSKHEGY